MEWNGRSQWITCHRRSATAAIPLFGPVPFWLLWFLLHNLLHELECHTMESLVGGNQDSRPLPPLCLKGWQIPPRLQSWAL